MNQIMQFTTVDGNRVALSADDILGVEDVGSGSIIILPHTEYAVKEKYEEILEIDSVLMRRDDGMWRNNLAQAQRDEEAAAPVPFNRHAEARAALQDIVRANQ